MHMKFKMADFLLGLGNSSKRLFCTSGDDTNVYQILFIYVKVKDGLFSLGGASEHKDQ